MTILFISDLHLSENDPKTAALFLAFLRTQATQAQALYILGDFFEFWIGDDDVSAFYGSIKASLKELTQRGARVYLMHGNRDFLLGDRFMAETGCMLLKEDEVLIDLYGQRTLIMHGDTLCTADRSYQRFRSFVQKPWFKTIFLKLPLRARHWLNRKMREKSTRAVNQKDLRIMDVTQTEVERILNKYKTTHLIHGHTHRPDVHHFELDAKPATRTVLGAWHETGNVLVCSPKGCELKTLPA